ncbi:hypothetical protein GGS21DRAFT_72 [Xylaria nigripes]|nr:hypothetical protein GGS21DRAFT_72 [Xylaria nigripes]
MPPRLPAHLRPHGHRRALLNAYSLPDRQLTCFFCSFSLDFSRKRVPRRPKRAPLSQSRRYEGTIATTHNHVNIDPRKELESVLLSLEECASNHVNLSRLQLALSGLRQKPGHESIRVAILDLSSRSTATNTAKEVLRLMFADPLKDPEAWEHEIDANDLSAPMIIRIGAADPGVEAGISLIKGISRREVYISPVTFGGYNFEILLAHADVPAPKQSQLDELKDTVIVPTADALHLDTSRFTSSATAVHKTLIIADGMHGAASILSMPPSKNSGLLRYAVNFPEYKPAETTSLPFTPIDTGVANIGLGLVRKNISNAIEYKHLWFQSNIAELVEWLKADILTTSDGVTQPPVRELIASLLDNTSASIQTEAARQLERLLKPTEKPTYPKRIEKGLSEWGESAHSELQKQLDLAFSGRRWRKLNWWKLFWRVDDVGMLTSDILAQKFLTEAERSSIFLAGQMKEAGINLSPKSNTAVIAGGQNGSTDSSSDVVKPSRKEIRWPMNIPDARVYLQTETVPALQALAQKLVLQTLSTSGLMTTLGGLVYVGTLTTTIYEAGAFAALGIVWSMKRMQKQWQTARKFWEGEVREEGRKAVRSIEEAMASALRESNMRGQESDHSTTRDKLEKAGDLVSRAKELLRQLK